MIDLLLFDLGNTLLDYHQGPLTDREKDLLGLNQLHLFLKQIGTKVSFEELYVRFFSAMGKRFATAQPAEQRI